MYKAITKSGMWADMNEHIYIYIFMSINKWPKNMYHQHDWYIFQFKSDIYIYIYIN